MSAPTGVGLDVAGTLVGTEVGMEVGTVVGTLLGTAEGTLVSWLAPSVSLRCLALADNALGDSGCEVLAEARTFSYQQSCLAASIPATF